MKGRVIKKYWLDLILAGRTTWEIRGSGTGARGPIALIKSGTGMVVGVCELVDVVGPLTRVELLRAKVQRRAAAEDVVNLEYAAAFPREIYLCQEPPESERLGRLVTR